MFDNDLNGRFHIELHNSNMPDVEADYMFVHFTLPLENVLQDGDADKLEEVKFSRYTRSQLNVEDSSPERLAVREEVTKARISSLSRKL